MKIRKTGILVIFLTICFVFELFCITFNISLPIFVLTKNNMGTCITYFSALFFHSGLLHFTGNTVMLFILGYYLEIHEKKDNIVTLFIMGVLANFIYAHYFMSSTGGLIGASAGIYVIKGYALFVTRFWLIRVYLLWSIINNILAVLIEYEDGIAYEVHIIGAIIGIAYSMLEFIIQKEKSIE